jgi:hypothetical protein
MKERVIGKIKNLVILTDSSDIEVTIRVTDPKFRKQLLRDLSLSGNLRVDGTEVIFVGDDDDA